MTHTNHNETLSMEQKIKSPHAPVRAWGLVSNVMRFVLDR
jgi:hypothetical protein